MAMKKKMLHKGLSAALSLVMMCSLLPAHSFAADKPLTRGEMAAILVENAGLSDQVKAYADKASAFTDVAEGSAYEGVINLAYEKGFVSGVGGGKFAPEKPITQLEAASIVERFLEVPKTVLNKWPAAYDRTVVSTGLAENTKYESASPATKAFAEQLFHNAKQMQGKPFIGISWKKDDQDYSSFHQIIKQAGGIAVELPQIMNKEGGHAVA